MSNSVNARVFTVARNADEIGYVGSGVAIAAGWHFALTSVINPSEFTSLFEMYRINSVELTFNLRTDPGAASSIGVAIYPKLYYYIDNSTASGAGLAPAAIRERGNSKMMILDPNKFTKIKFTPSALVPIAGGAEEAKKRPWLQTEVTSTPHYAFNFCVDNLPTGALMSVFIKYSLSFKGLK